MRDVTRAGVPGEQILRWILAGRMSVSRSSQDQRQGKGGKRGKTRQRERERLSCYAISMDTVPDPAGGSEARVTL